MASTNVPGNGEGNGNPLQCSCLENPRDGGGLVGCRLRGRTESEVTEATQQQCAWQRQLGLAEMLGKLHVFLSLSLSIIFISISISLFPHRLSVSPLHICYLNSIFMWSLLQRNMTCYTITQTFRSANTSSLPLHSIEKASLSAQPQYEGDGMRSYILGSIVHQRPSLVSECHAECDGNSVLRALRC